MATEIKVPSLGESVSSATVARWLKTAGQSVSADEPLVELETDKVTVEVNAPEAGQLASIAAETGQEVEVGAVLGVIERAGAGSGAKPPVAAKPASEAKPESATRPAPVEAGPVQDAAKPSASSPSPLPAAAKLMQERHLSSQQVGPGSGKDGRITKGDVLAFVAPHAAAPAIPPAPARASSGRDLQAGEERVRMTRLRRTIAARLKEAQNTAAMLTTFNEVDMSACMELRSTYRQAFEAKYSGVRLGFMGFFVRACVGALHEFPAVNAEMDGEDLIYRDFVHMGIAVGGPNGLVVPVIRHAERLSLAEIESAVAAYGKAARDGTLKIEDLAGGTFSITNGGVYGSLMSTPILNPPQSAILGMHKIQDRPIAVDGRVEIRPMMYLALTYDHRVIDGKEAVSFLVRVKQSIEDPRRLVLGI